MTDPEVRAYLGGPADRREVEAILDAQPLSGRPLEPGSDAVADRTTDKCLGVVRLDRRAASRPGHVAPAVGEELEISYSLVRGAWVMGMPRRPPARCSRRRRRSCPTSPSCSSPRPRNQRSLALAVRLGFVPAGTFTEFDAEQTLAVAQLATFVA